jgi:hypothetical protein
VYISESWSENMLLSAGREVAGATPLSDRAAFPLLPQGLKRDKRVR